VHASLSTRGTGEVVTELVHEAIAGDGPGRGWLARPAEAGIAAGFGVYLHVPFCHHRCGYCDFATEPVGGLAPLAREDVMRRYVAALCDDVRAQAAVRAHPQVTSVFVGGGTPTLLPPEGLAAVLDVTAGVFDLAADVEITVECNPETAELRIFEVLAAAGVNRISMGAQSFDPGVLRTLDRLHRPDRVAEAVEQVRRGGIDAVSVDLIYGTPGESADSWAATLAAVVAMNVDHVSAYALSVHANTPLARAVAAGTTPSPDDDVQRDRFDQGRDALAAAGYEHYEVSNFARGPRARSRHNVLYWRHGDYLGLGVGAHAHRDGRRWWTTRSTERYLAASEASAHGAAGAQSASGVRGRDEEGRLLDVTGEEILDDEARRLERLLLGLRVREGLHRDDLPPLSATALDEVVGLGLVRLEGERLAATEAGWFLLDETVRRLTVGP